MSSDGQQMLATRDAAERLDRGLMGWLRRLVAGKELDALRARVASLSNGALVAADEAKTSRAQLEGRIAAMSKQLDAELRRCQDLEQRLAAASATLPVDEDALLSPLRLEIEQHARDQAELERTIARKERERHEAAAKLVEARSDVDALEKKLQKSETALRAAEIGITNAEERARQAEARAADATRQARARSREDAREVTDLRNEVERLKQRATELAAANAALTTQRDAEVSGRDETIASLEARLAEALAGQLTDAPALERALRDRDAVIEELELALTRQRTTERGG